jgi:hypothetical protein
MTGDISKNRLVKLGYDPRTGFWHRRRFFDNKAIPQLFLTGAINALKKLIFEVKSLEKEYPNTLKSMEADLFQLECEREYAKTPKAKASARRKAKAKAKASAKTKKRNNLPKLPQPAPTSLKFSAKCAECSSVLGAGATVRIYGDKIYGLYCHTEFIKDRPEKGSIRLTTGQ